jgi:penicillin-binding protein 1A
MKTSLERRRRLRRNGNGSRRGRGGATSALAIGVPLFLFSTFLVVGLIGLVGAVGAYNMYSQGLPDPQKVFSTLTFTQQSIVYDRTGKVELARFGQQQRQVTEFKDLPPVVVDATTSIEDHTFWTNAGFDPVGIVSAGIDTINGRERGASTITQQLVRNRLLPQAVLDGNKYERKVKEIIQSIRLTQEFPGTDGKQKIMAAYLNQNYYGNQAYGIKAAAQAYFGVSDMKKLTIAQAAILAAIPQSPSTYDLVKNAEEDDNKRLIVPQDSRIVLRRNQVLQAMLSNRVLTAPSGPFAVPGAAISDQQIQDAMSEPVVLATQEAASWKAPHFVWQVRHQLGEILCGVDNADQCELVDSGGYRIVTSLDWNMQQIAEKWVKAAAIAPNASNFSAELKRLKVPNLKWIADLRNKGIYNSALAAIDYRTGQIMAYVGSGGYDEKARGKKFQPKFDVLADGWRQSGSAFKPINYITGLDDKTMTAATLFMDVVTNFGGGYTPTDADNAERGPLRMREAIQLSLNIPAIKAAIELTPGRVYDQAREFGISFAQKKTDAGSAIAIGTLNLHYADLISAFGAIANGGVLMPRTAILTVTDAAGKPVYPIQGSQKPAGKQVVSPQAAYIMTDILSSNTDPKINPFWGKREILKGKVRRPAALKTGTTNDEIDLAAMGYLAPPKDPKAPALVVGAWMGNSDNSFPRNPTVALETSATLWQSFMTQASKSMPIADFKSTKPSGLVTAKVDAYSGMKPGPFSRRTVSELFIEGTVPTDVDNTKTGMAIDQATGKLWNEGCTGPKVTKGFLDLSKVEPGFPQWRSYTRGWIARAARGSGVRGGPKRTPTAYFGFGSFLPYGATWGAPFPPKGTCEPQPSPSPSPSPGESVPPSIGPTPTPKPSKPRIRWKRRVPSLP